MNDNDRLAPAPAAPRLTSLSHGGGCGCKIAPGVLSALLARSTPLTATFPNLLVGTETADDAAVYKLNDEQAIVATTDFFMPIVDDPYDFGRIAATNALSDVYAMGGKPILALALVGMPINTLPHEVIAQVLRGGEDVCAAAGIPVAGGHSIDSVEPIYGLAALGVVHPERVKRNASARATCSCSASHWAWACCPPRSKRTCSTPTATGPWSTPPRCSTSRAPRSPSSKACTR